jgi:hypothetical protein
VIIKRKTRIIIHILLKNCMSNAGGVKISQNKRETKKLFFDNLCNF